MRSRVRHGSGLRICSSRPSSRTSGRPLSLVALVDDHRLFSASLSMALQTAGLDVLAPTLTSMTEVLEVLLDAHPAVVMLDRDLGPLGSGEALISPLSEAGAWVIVVSGTLDEVVMGRCLAKGATTCVSKSDPFEDLLGVALSVMEGRKPLPDAERYRLIGEWRRWQASTNLTKAPFSQLTSREAAVLGKLMDGRSVKGIAEDDFVSEATVRSQVRGILGKLGVSSQLEAVAAALRAQWRPPSPRADGSR